MVGTPHVSQQVIQLLAGTCPGVPLHLRHERPGTFRISNDASGCNLILVEQAHPKRERIRRLGRFGIVRRVGDDTFRAGAHGVGFAAKGVGDFAAKGAGLMFCR